MLLGISMIELYTNPQRRGLIEILVFSPKKKKKNKKKKKIIK